MTRLSANAINSFLLIHINVCMPSDVPDPIISIPFVDRIYIPETGDV